jgi:hypothetical protein
MRGLRVSHRLVFPRFHSSPHIHYTTIALKSKEKYARFQKEWIEKWIDESIYGVVKLRKTPMRIKKKYVEKRRKFTANFA